MTLDQLQDHCQTLGMFENHLIKTVTKSSNGETWDESTLRWDQLLRIVNSLLKGETK